MFPFLIGHLCVTFIICSVILVSMPLFSLIILFTSYLQVLFLVFFFCFRLSFYLWFYLFLHILSMSFFLLCPDSIFSISLFISLRCNIISFYPFVRPLSLLWLQFLLMYLLFRLFSHWVMSSFRFFYI